MLYKEDWNKVKQRLEAYWENEIIDRCCVGVYTKKDGVTFDREKYKKPTTHEDILKWYRDPELVLERGIAGIESSYYGGDTLPIISPEWGGSGYALYFDCKYIYTEDSLWFPQTLQSPEEYCNLKFDPTNGSFLEHKKFLNYIVEQAKGKFMVGTPDYIGNFDAVLCMRGTEEALMDMVDEPELVKNGIMAIREGMKAAGKEFYEILKASNEGGSIVPWFSTWAKGRHCLVQCDLSAMLSPRLFEEFILPDLEKTCEWLDYAAYHIDGQVQLQFLDMLLSVKGIKALQWTNVEGQPSVLHFIPIFKKIQKAGKQLIIYCKANELQELLSQLSSKGLMINVESVPNEYEAKEIIKKVEKWTVE